MTKRGDDWRTAGEEPDPRFTFANERTFLAWHRTALALIGAGVAVTQVLPPFSIPGGRKLLGLPLIVLGGLIAVTSYGRWQANQRALRLAEPLPEHWMPRLVGVVIGVAAAIALVFTIIGPA